MEYPNMSQTKARKDHVEHPHHTSSESTVATHPSMQSSKSPENEPSCAPPAPSSRSKLPFRDRIKHFTFAWFLCTMSTGGLAIALAETPHKFRGLYTIGLITFLLTLFLFTLFTILLTLRLLLHPTHILGALSHPSESWFLGSFFLSTSVLIGCTQVYGITYGPAYPWLIDAIHVLYWIYAGFSFANSVGQYWVLVARSKVRPVAFTPSMFLAGYSAMLTGTLASLIAPYQDPGRAYLVVLSGLTFQGFGWLVSSTCLVFFVRGLLDTGLPPAKVRPALFIPVGSVSYTIVALVGQANGVPEGIGYFAKHPQAKDTCQVFALMVSVFMYLFSVWLFLLAVLGNISVVGNMQFSLSWWAFIFPNVGFMLATNALGRELESEPILWVASGLTVALVVVWIVAAVGCVRAVWRGEIVWPGKDEDKDL